MVGGADEGNGFAQYATTSCNRADERSAGRGKTQLDSLEAEYTEQVLIQQEDSDVGAIPADIEANVADEMPAE